MWCERRHEGGGGANQCGRNTIAILYLDSVLIIFFDITLYLDVRQQELFQFSAAFFHQRNQE